jgi:hypothetical protein
MLSFNISYSDLIKITLQILLKEGIGGESRPKDTVTLLWITLIYSKQIWLMVVKCKRVPRAYNGENLFQGM